MDFALQIDHHLAKAERSLEIIHKSIEHLSPEAIVERCPSYVSQLLETVQELRLDMRKASMARAQMNKEWDV